MVLVSENDILRIIQKGLSEGVSNIDISRNIINEYEGEEPNLSSIKVMVSRKTKQLIDKGDIKKRGRRFIITEKGIARLKARTVLTSNFKWNQKLLSNIHVSFASPLNPTRLIYERKDFEETLKKLDEIIGEEDIMLLIKQKKVSRETS